MNKIPIHIVTGFLGSGKTTFIQQILKNDQNAKTLVLINEFGEVGLDDLLVKPINDNTYLLSSGCMCCTVLTDLKDTLLSTLDLNKDALVFDKILIETTGLANPASILSTLTQDMHLKGRFVLHGMTAIIDAQHAHTQATTAPEWLPQVIACQQYVLSKTDLCQTNDMIYLQTLINEVNPDAIEVHVDDFINMQALFTKTFDVLPKSTFFLKSEQDIHAKTQSLLLSFDKPIDWLAFGLWLSLLLDQYGEHVLRLKGVLHLQGIDKPILLQGVQHCLYPPEHLPAPMWYDDISRLVMIVRGLDVADIERSAKTVLSHLRKV